MRSTGYQLADDSGSGPKHRLLQIGASLGLPKFASVDLAVTVASVALLGCVLILPWQLGGYGDSHQRQLALSLAIASILACIYWWHWRNEVSSSPTIGWMMIAVIALGLLQQVPLPSAIVGQLSPEAVRLRHDLPSVATSEELRSGKAAEVIPETQTISLAAEKTRRMVWLLLLATIVFWLAFELLNTSRSQLMVCVAIVIQGTMLAAWGLVQSYTRSDSLLGGTLAPPNSFYFSTWANHATAAGYLTMCLGGAIALGLRQYYRTASSWHRGETFRAKLRQASSPQMIALAVSVVILLWALIVAKSRGAMVAVVIASLALLVSMSWTRLKRHRMSSILIAASLLLLPVWLSLSLFGVRRYQTLVDGGVMNDGRLAHWQDTLSTIPLYYRLGSGLGTYGFAYLAQQRSLNRLWFNHAHNEYLESLIELGIPGLLGVACIICLMAVTLYIALTSSQLIIHRWFAFGFLFVFVSQLVLAMTDFGLHMPSNLMLLSLLGGSICGATAATRSNLPLTRWVAIDSPIPRPVLGCGVFLLLVVTSQTAARSWAESESTGQRNKKVLAMRDGDQLSAISEAIKLTSKAIEAAPDDLELRIQIASLYATRYETQMVLTIVGVIGTKSKPTQQAMDKARRLVSPVGMYRQIQTATGEERESVRERLRNLAVVRENILPAYGHLRVARTLCPIVPEVHYRLGLYAPLLGVNDAPHLHITARLRQCDPLALYQIGLLHFHSNRIFETCECWQRAISLSSEFRLPIVQMAIQKWDAELISNAILPPQAEDQLAIAEAIFASPATVRDTPAHDKLFRLCLRQAESFIEYHGAEEARSYSRQMARIKLLENEKAAAAAHFQAAVKLDPNDFVLRYQYAELLHALGDEEASLRHVQMCISQRPTVQAYKNLRARIIRAQSSVLDQSRPTNLRLGK